MALSTKASVSGPWPTALTLLKDHRHVVEVGEVRLEERLVDPVLSGVEDVVDPDLGGGDSAQGHGMFGVGIPNLGPVPCSPAAEGNTSEARLDPDLNRMARRQLAVDLAGRVALTANGVGEAVFVRQFQNDRPVDPEAGGRPVAAVDVANEIRVGIAPAEHRVIRTHHG